MAMTSKAPPPTYKRKLYVGDHPVEQLRTRTKKRGVQNQEKLGLRNLIDSMVRSAIDQGYAENYIDEGIPSLLVPLQEVMAEDLWAIVRDNTLPSRHQYPQVVVTLLEDWQVQRSRASGKWVFPQYSDAGFHVGFPQEALANLQVVLPKEPPKEEPPMSEGVGKTNGVLSILIVYRNKEGTSAQEEWQDPEIAEARVNELRKSQRIDPSSIRVFREIPTEVKLVL